MDATDFYRYWGKSRRKAVPEGDPYHLLAYHCLDVAACGYMLVQQNRFGAADILAELDLYGEEAARWVGFLFACHDIGKFASGFQKLADHPGSPLVPPARGAIAGARHDSLGYYLWHKLSARWLTGELAIFPGIACTDREDYLWALDIWMTIATGHHGIPPDKSSSCISAFIDRDYHAAAGFLSEINTLFPCKNLPALWLSSDWLTKLKQQSWLLAGLMTIADWVGSNEQYFPFVSQVLPLQKYWLYAGEKAMAALSHLPSPSLHSRYVGVQALFPFIHRLTPLQQRAATLDIEHPGAQLLIFEDVTGAGKTEAALIAAQRLLARKEGGGIYVGLPTMATANAMYLRLSKAYRALYSEEARPSLVLAHGGSRMSAAFADSVWYEHAPIEGNDYANTDRSASSECHAWFADSRKKALLAEVGVGTLDQVLMAVMPYRHQSLRLLGIRDKVLLLDEVHAYDSYMVRLLEGLLQFHAAQGGSAIILSATLPAKLREKLLAAFSRGAGFPVPTPTPDAGYPWLCHLSAAGLCEEPLDTPEEVQRSVTVNWLNDSSQAIDLIYRAVEAGECICWVRNTVKDALVAFQRLVAEGKIPEENLLLFHSRFAFGHRMAIEEKTLGWFSKTAPAAARRGKVLIATQVVEQSLDIDLDNMISDLAPIDLLIQRAGRLQRHIRDAQGNCKSSLPDERPSPVLHLLAPEWQEQAQEGWLGDELRGTGFVYADHAVLWRTQALLRQKARIRMPDDARFLVDGVYEALIPAPPELQTLSDRVFGTILSSHSAATQNLLQRDEGYDRQASGCLWDEERQFSTRLGETSTDVYLAWLDRENQLQPVIRAGDFQWEKSRVQVRTTWWTAHKGGFSLPDDALLERFRQQQRRPGAEVLLVSEEGEAAYYSPRLGLTG